MSAAKAAKKPIRVLDKTDESTEVLANPDGTFTWTQHLRPVRVKQSGKWTPADTTLERRPDGTIAPRATVVGLTLSGGGKGSKARGPLVRMAAKDVEAGISWLDDVPEPVLDGPTATYRDVLPGVDLRVTADVLGYSQVLVVKTPEAARNPKLRKITFGSYAKGGAVAVTKGAGQGKRSDLPPGAQVPGDGLQVADGSGAATLRGDASAMWDSSAESTPELRGTGLGARTAKMGVEVTDGAISIEPDQAFLGASTTKYPVYLDPEYNCTSCGKAHHVVVQSAWPTAKNFDRTTGDLTDLKAGYVCEGSCFVSRTYLRMNTGSLWDKKIHSAYLHLDTLHSYHCSGATPTQLYLAGWFDENTDWNNKPGAVGAMLSSGNTTKNVNYCPGNPGGMDLAATSAIESAAAGHWGETTFMLRGEQEGNNTSWRRFDLNPYLVVKYNSYPNSPSDFGVNGWGMAANQALPCATGANRPIIGTKTPRLRARVSDPDGGSLNAAFHLLVGTEASHTWDGTTMPDANVPSGEYAEVTVPAGKIGNDGVYSWHLNATDGQLTTWSRVCEMALDTKVPDAPKVSSATYLPGLDAGGIGVSSTFTIQPPKQGEAGYSGENDIAYYLYALPEHGDDPQRRLDPKTFNGLATLAWTPKVSGPQIISIVSVDRAGNRSPKVEYQAEVADYRVAVSGKVGHWSLEDTAVDTSGARSLIFDGVPGGFYTGSRNGQGQRAALFEPREGDHYRTRIPLTHTNTVFSVEAWAKLDSKSANATVLGQDGLRRSGFKLYYDQAADKWAFEVPHADSDTSALDRVLSSAVPKVDLDPTDPAGADPAWTHLVAVYDPVARKARLYVDGVKSEITLTGTPWDATGATVIGGAKVKGLRADTFAGSIDSVGLFNKVLSDTEVTSRLSGSLSGGTTVEYSFEDSNPDDYNFEGLRENARVAELQTSLGPPLFGPGYVGRGVDAGATSVTMGAGSILSTTHSFTVGAWVKLKDKNGHYAVASQYATNTSGFILRYAKDVDKWIFGLAAADAAQDNYQWAIGTSQPKAGEWTHVAGVFDSVLKTATIYVNGIKEDDSPIPTNIAATGGFIVGDGDQLGHSVPMRLTGSIDEVVAFNGAVTDEDLKDFLTNKPVELARYALDETAGGTAANSVVGGVAASVYGDGVTWGQTAGRAAANFDGNGVVSSGRVSGAGPRAAWSFDNTTADYSGNGNNLQHGTPSAVTQATYLDTRVGAGVKLNGVDQRLIRGAPVLNTDASYSISAWVKPDRTDIGYAVVSQDGARTSPFMLEHIGGKWTFTMLGSDSDSPAVVRTYSTLAPKANVWTHLLGVYDKQAGKVRLYVNGYLEGESAATTSWNSTGSFTVGRGRWAGSSVGYFPGTVDEIRAYDRVLTASDAHGLWNLSSDISAQRPTAFRVDKSFTVSAWVRPTAYGAASRQAISLGATGRFSALMVGYRPEWNRWGLLTETGGGLNAGTTKWILSDNTADSYANADGWVHLTVSYDVIRKKASLYVNGISQTTVPTGATTFAKVQPSSEAAYAGSNLTLAEPARDLLIGRATWEGLPSDQWAGAIRDVRVFSGILPQACDVSPVCISQLPI